MLWMAGHEDTSGHPDVSLEHGNPHPLWGVHDPSEAAMKRSSQRADQLARSHTDTAIATLAAIMNNTLSEDKDRIKAADSLLDRGHGKPLAAVIQLPPSKIQLQLLAAAEDDELLEIMRARPLPRLGHDEAIEGEFTASTVESTPAVALRSQVIAGFVDSALSQTPAGAHPNVEPADAAEFPSIAKDRDPLLD